MKTPDYLSYDRYKKKKKKDSSKNSVLIATTTFFIALLLFSVVAQAPIVLLLTYFLLASGEHFRRKIVQFAGPSFTRKKDVIKILDEINKQIQLYLLSMLIASLLMGLSVWLAFKSLGMEQAGLWGVIAGILQFIP